MPPELDCLIGILPLPLLQEATGRSRELGIGADRVLIAWSAITEAAYLRRFAHCTGIAVETFANWAPSDGIVLRDDQMIHAARGGTLPIRRGDELALVVSPRHLMARNLIRAIDNDPALAVRLRVATAADFDNHLLHRSTRVLARNAAYGLSDRCASLSAAPRPIRHPHRTRSTRVAASLALGGLLALPPDLATGVWSQMLALWFIAAIGLRSVAACLPPRPPPSLSRQSDHDLPVYTVLVALYREERSVAPLLRALNALDYPREKLDVIFAVEADDLATRNAIARFGAMPHLRVVVAPSEGPRTKPKALNCALSFARGRFIAVFDAEDRPDPDQLHAALATFRSEGDDVACAQASLCIHNAADSLFARMFATEYAGHFDIVLPGLAAMRLPLPLGGTSNHFRTDVLRDIGGWDAWNVTEDADLGLRLARFGYRAVTFGSTTQEEAPIRFAAWVKQRSRWMKGWMQTWSIHMRDPRRLWRESGWRGMATLNLVIGGNVLSAMAYPFLLGGIAIGLVSDNHGLRDGLLTPVHFIAIAAGIAATVAVGVMGLTRRGRLRDSWILLLTPIYWGCLSIATWRAFFQLLRDPYRWEKTEHGLARTKTNRHSGRGRRLPNANPDSRHVQCDPIPDIRWPAGANRKFRNDGAL